MADPDLDDIERRMNGAREVLRSEFGGLRTGRASASLLDPIMVDAYGAQMPLNQVGTVSVPEPRMISVQVWDASLVRAVEKSIRNSGLGLNPIVDGQMLRLPIPELTEERRQEISKIAARYTEQARIAVRNVRRDGMDQLKRLEREGEISQDEQHAYGDDIQTLTDDIIANIDLLLEEKEKEIMQV